MTWEEAVISIRNKPEWQHIVDGCYFDENLVKNVERFRTGDEFIETLRLLRKYLPNKKLKVLDIGAGNGISALSFALQGFEVTALEPDPSDTIGNGAIKKLKEHYKLPNLTIVDTWGENMPFPDNYFDVTYARQVMHHAHDLHEFVKEAFRVTKKGGIYFANRDHIVNDEKQLQEFLNIHPLNKFYGGENAYSLAQYSKAIHAAGFRIKKIFEHMESVILTDKNADKHQFRERLAKHIGPQLAGITFLEYIYRWYLKKKHNNYADVPGRVYAFICQK